MRQYFKSLFFLIILSACAPLNLSDGTDNMTISSTSGNIYKPSLGSLFERTGCQDFRAYVWNYIYNISSDKNKKPVSYYAMKEQTAKKLFSLAKDASPEDINRFAMHFVSLYALVSEFLQQNEEEDNTTTLVQFEHGVVHQNHEEFAEKLEEALSQLEQTAKEFNKNCPENIDYSRETNHTGNQYAHNKWFFNMKRNMHPLVYGAKKVMSTAYQSCSVLDLPLMNNEQDTQGVQIKSKHPSNRGYLRNISDLSQVNRSHYYLSQIYAPTHTQCLNIHASPLLYDYGGKPSTSIDSINLFQNAGSGSKQMLGVDCSGFVATAMAAAGLRLKQRMFIRPIHVKGISAWMLKNANRNDLSCLEKQDISVRNPLQPGDIIASDNHVAIVDMVDENEDSFSITGVQSASDCHSSKIKLNRLNFSIIQSSAHNNSVGINRMHIAESLNSMDSNFVRGLKRIASRTCYKRFEMETHTDINEISILRHTIHEPSCRDREIYLERQECLQSCEPVSI